MLRALRRHPPSVDPVKEQISVLQKQLPQLQKDQSDAWKDDQSAIVQALSTKVKTQE